MLLIVGKGVRGVICDSVIKYATSVHMQQFMKDYDKNKDSSYLKFKYSSINILYGWTLLQKLLVNDFEWVEDISEFNENFIKSYNEESDQGYFFEVDIQYPKNLHNLHNDLPFLPEKMKIETV